MIDEKEIEAVSVPRVQPFADNWSYLKAELAWLDNLLMRSLAKQRQENHEIERVAKNAADRVSSHWWRGFIMLDPSKGGSRVPQTQQIIHPLGRYGDRIVASREAHIRLALPTLCDRLRLGQFERNLLVLCLAPEISRRYERIYSFLNNDETNCRQPTVDLALRLFCRSDAEWRKARQSFSHKAPLIKRNLLELYIPDHSNARSLLSKAMLLNEKLINFLLSEDIPMETIIAKPRKKHHKKDW